MLGWGRRNSLAPLHKHVPVKRSEGDLCRARTGPDLHGHGPGRRPGRVVEDPAEIRPAVERALASDQVAVVHIRMDPKVTRISGGVYLR